MPQGLRKAEVRLTAKQRRFAAEYLVDLCGAKAAVRAGYSAKTADRIASRLLRNPGVAAILTEHTAQVGQQLNLTVERLERELARVAYVDPRKLRGEGGRVLDLHELDEDTARAVASVKHRIARVVRGAKAAPAAKALGIEPDLDGRKVEELVLATVETRLHNKVEAIGLGFKRLGALVERHEVSMATTVPDITDEEYELLALLHHRIRPQVQATECRPATPEQG